MASTDFARSFPVSSQSAASDRSESSGLTIEIRHAIEMVQVFAKIGKTAAVAKKLKISDRPGQATVSKAHTALPLSPGQWMVVGIQNEGYVLRTEIAEKLKAIGYVSEQSASRACFRVSGPNVKEFMERCCRLDLHPTKASAGFCGQTQMAQIGVLMHQVSDEPVYDLFVYSGFAQDFLDWLVNVGEKFGVELV